MVADLKLPLGSRCIKYLMFIFNLLFVITGIILISIGVTIRAAYDDYQHLLDEKFFSVPTLLVTVGSIIFFIAFFGCCGAVRENYCMIITFTTLLVLIFILELSAGIAGYVLRNDAYAVIESKMKSTMAGYNDTKTYAKTWDELQTKLECCGIRNGSDWATLSDIHQVPTSCCKREFGDYNSSSCQETPHNWYPNGCLDALTRFIKAHAVQLGGAGIGLAFIQAVGIWFAIYLARAVKLSYETV
uniref:Tetraspanin n=1 Tax=Meteorus pulchricornis TaxID=51522 RepID=H7CHJ1_9HYME|nr:tetraspanin [Meteorus pulchricornis]